MKPYSPEALAFAEKISELAPDTLTGHEVAMAIGSLAVRYVKNQRDLATLLSVVYSISNSAMEAEGIPCDCDNCTAARGRIH